MMVRLETVACDSDFWLRRAWRGGNSNPVSTYGDNGTGFQSSPMPLEDLGHQGHAPLRRHVREAYQP